MCLNNCATAGLHQWGRGHRPVPDHVPDRGGRTQGHQLLHGGAGSSRALVWCQGEEGPPSQLPNGHVASPSLTSLSSVAGGMELAANTTGLSGGLSCTSVQPAGQGGSGF